MAARTWFTRAECARKTNSPITIKCGESVCFKAGGHLNCNELFPRKKEGQNGRIERLTLSANQSTFHFETGNLFSLGSGSIAFRISELMIYPR